MPAKVRTHRKAHGGYRNPHYHITSPEKGTVGHSSSRKKAEASARIRTQKSKRK
jgi:hypothetical protein